MTAPPEKLHKRTATVFGALTLMLPIRPAAMALGQPGATASPTAAPGSAKVWSAAQDAFAIEPKVSDAEAVR